MDALHERLRKSAGYRNLGEGAFTARKRHIDALKHAAEHFATGRVALQETRAGELLAEELRLAQDNGMSLEEYFEAGRPYRYGMKVVA